MRISAAASSLSLPWRMMKLRSEGPRRYHGPLREAHAEATIAWIPPTRYFVGRHCRSLVGRAPCCPWHPSTRAWSATLVWGAWHLRQRWGGTRAACSGAGVGFGYHHRWSRATAFVPGARLPHLSRLGLSLFVWLSLRRRFSVFFLLSLAVFGFRAWPRPFLGFRLITNSSSALLRASLCRCISE